ncbi:uncharacterized protein Bfra_006272 [Botrytis fragariae]|uniref:Uncharacterized protein n=1 Tax=Botrytis fragariae TaxID=1964551 RepID=A0A8H6B427_9HELO|nr:uncharacterized protein Bfra_006272 [Botrytis fragariae]KAF5879068.1 hypothetical protein Bfra_006272 [Botrytis fragariae]
MLNGANNEATGSHIEVATATVTKSNGFPALIERIDNGKASTSPHDRDGDDVDVSDEILRRVNVISRVD